MVDPTKILKRAWYILWNYRTLWIFGLILALTAGGGGNGGGGNSGYQYSSGESGGEFPSGRFEQWFQEFFKPLSEMPEKELISILIWIGVGLLCFFLLIAILFAVARYVSETAVIRMVNEYEQSEVKVGFQEGWRYGWSRTSWRLFLINLLVNLPVIILLLLFFVIGLMVFFTVDSGARYPVIASIVGILLVFLLLLLPVIVLQVVLNLLREFFWRVCALENLGVMESLRRGFGLVRRNWKSVGLMWLLLLGIGIAWIIASVLLFFLLIPIFLVMLIPAAIIAGLLAVIVYGITNLFLSMPLAVIVAFIFGLPLFFLVTFLPLIAVQGLARVFSSSVWTLTYREMLLLNNPVHVTIEPKPA